MNASPVIMTRTTLRLGASFDVQDSLGRTLLAQSSEDRYLLDLARGESPCRSRTDQVFGRENECSHSPIGVGTTSRPDTGREASSPLLRQSSLREPRPSTARDMCGEYSGLEESRQGRSVASGSGSSNATISRGALLESCSEDRIVLDIRWPEEHQRVRASRHARRNVNAGSSILMDAGSWPSRYAARSTQVRQPSVCESGPFVSWKLHNQWSGQGSEGTTVERGYVFGGNPDRRPSSSNSSEVRTS